jgi:methionyl aminopeptidase
MKIFLKTEDEIELMRQANRLVGQTLGELAKHIKPGVTTLQLDRIAEEFIRDHGAVPTFKGFPNPYGGPFPAASAHQLMMLWYMVCRTVRPY